MALPERWLLIGRTGLADRWPSRVLAQTCNCPQWHVKPREQIKFDFWSRWVDKQQSILGFNSMFHDVFLWGYWSVPNSSQSCLSRAEFRPETHDLNIQVVCAAAGFNLVHKWSEPTSWEIQFSLFSLERRGEQRGCSNHEAHCHWLFWQHVHSMIHKT